MLVGDFRWSLTGVTVLLFFIAYGERPEERVQVSVEPFALQSLNDSAKVSFSQIQATVENKEETGASAPEMLPLVWHWIPKHDDMTPFNAFYAIQHHLRSKGDKCFGWHAADAYEVMHRRYGVTALEDFLAAVPRDGKHSPEWRVTLVCKSKQGVVFSVGVDWKHTYNAATNQHPKLGFHVWHRLQLPSESANVQSKRVFADIWTNMRNAVLDAAPGGDDPTILAPVTGDATTLTWERFEKERKEKAQREIEARKQNLLHQSKHATDAM